MYILSFHRYDHFDELYAGGWKDYIEPLADAAVDLALVYNETADALGRSMVIIIEQSQKPLSSRSLPIALTPEQASCKDIDRFTHDLYQTRGGPVLITAPGHLAMDARCRLQAKNLEPFSVHYGLGMERVGHFVSSFFEHPPTPAQLIAPVPSQGTSHF